MNGGLFQVEPEFTVWGTFVQGETDRVLLKRNNKKEAAKIARDCGMAVVEKVFTEDEAWQIREEQM